MTFQPGATLYTQGFGSRAEGVEVPHLEFRDPSHTDIQYQIGKRWLNTISEEEFILYRFTVVNGITQAVWGTPVGATGAVISLADDSDTQVFPDNNGSIQFKGVANQIQVTASPSTHQLAIGATNPFDVQAFNSTGPVNLCTTTSEDVNIGNSSTTGQSTNINTYAVNIGTAGTTSINVGNSGTIAQANCPVNVNSFLKVQGSIALGNNFTVMDSNFVLFTSLSLIGPGTYNALGGETVLSCNVSAGALTINLSDIPPPGAFMYIYDNSGNAPINNITINAPAGYSFYEAAGSPTSTITVTIGYTTVKLLYGATGNYIMVL